MKAASRDEADLVLQVADLKGGRYLKIATPVRRMDMELFWRLLEAKGRRLLENRWLLDFMRRNRVPMDRNWWTGAKGH